MKLSSNIFKKFKILVVEIIDSVIEVFPSYRFGMF